MLAHREKIINIVGETSRKIRDKGNDACRKVMMALLLLLSCNFLLGQTFNPPRNLTVEAIAGGFTIAWNAPLPGSSYPLFDYRIEYSPNANFDFINTHGINVAPDILTWTTQNTPSGTIWVRVRARYNTGGSFPTLSQPSNVVSVNPLAVITYPPRNLSSEAGLNQITLIWEMPLPGSNVTLTGYRIERRVRNSMTWTTVHDIQNITTLSWTDTGLANGTTYHYRVRGHYPLIGWTNIHTSLPSNEVSSTTLVEIANPPVNLAFETGNQQVTLSWEAPLPGSNETETGYIIERRTIEGSWSQVHQTTNLSTLTWINTGLSNGNIYWYRVRALYIDYLSEPSNEVSATLYLKPPNNLTVESGYRQVTLVWEPPHEGSVTTLTGYRIERRTTGSWTQEHSVTPSTLTWVNVWLTNGTTYQYRVIAVYGQDNSVPSNVVEATPFVLANPPQNLSAESGLREVTLFWDPPQYGSNVSLTRYRIERRTTGSWSQVHQTTDNTTLTWTNTGLLNGTTYSYRIVALYENGLYSSSSNEVDATPFVIANPPQNLTAEPGPRQVTLGWEPPQNGSNAILTGYRIERRTTGSWSQVHQTTDPIALIWTNTELINETTYSFRVIAVYGVDSSIPSNEVEATPFLIVNPPQNLTAEPGPSRVTLGWEPPQNGSNVSLTGYRIERRTTGSWSQVHQTTDPVTLLWTNTGLINGTTYSFRVIAVYGQDNSVPSNEVNAIPFLTTNPPQNLTAEIIYQQIVLTWEAPLPGSNVTLTGYTIEHLVRTGMVGFDWVYYTNTSSLNFTTNLAPPGRSRTFRVRAVYGHDESASSNIVSITTPFIANPPQNLSAIAGNRQVSLNWETPLDGSDGIFSSYQLRWYNPETENWESLHWIYSMDNLSWTDNGLINGITYSYSVIAFYTIHDGLENLYFYSEPSNIASTTLPFNANPPRSLMTTAGNQQITLQWYAPLYGSDGDLLSYSIERRAENEEIWTQVHLNTDINSLVWTNTELSNGTYYEYRVFAIYSNPTNESEASNISGAIPYIAHPPQNLVAISGYEQVILSWDAPESESTGILERYEIEEGYFSWGSWHWSFIGETCSNTLTYNVTGLSNGTTYRYRVTAGFDNPGSNSLPSNEVSVVPNVNIPQNLTAIPGSAHVILRWQAPLPHTPNWQSYRIYRDGVHRYSTPSLTFTDNDVVNWMEYSYYITAVYMIENVSTESAPSNTITVIPTPFNPPSNLEAVVDRYTVFLTWNEPSEGSGSPFDFYRVYRSGIIIDETTDLAFTEYEVPIGLHIYSVQAVYVSGESGLVNVEVEVIPVSIGDEVVLFNQTTLKSNFPNPFNPETTIRFSVAKESNVYIGIYNVKGQRIKSLINGFVNSGDHQVIWNGSDESGRTVSSGLYFYRMRAGEYTSIKRMLLLK